jgi:hypothetical protein
LLCIGIISVSTLFLCQDMHQSIDIGIFLFETMYKVIKHSMTLSPSASHYFEPTDYYLPLTLKLPCAHRSLSSPHPDVTLCPLIITFALTLMLPCAHWSLPSPSPSRCLVPTDHYLRPHPHAALCSLITTFALTLTLPCAHWSLPSPSLSIFKSLRQGYQAKCTQIPQLWGYIVTHSQVITLWVSDQMYSNSSTLRIHRYA